MGKDEPFQGEGFPMYDALYAFGERKVAGQGDPR